jgi:cell division septation protein DedD
MVPKASIVAVLLSLTYAVSAFADFEEAATAFQRGEYSLAFTEFHILADQGDPEAQYVLGHMYQLGTGIVQDDTEALKWFQAAGEVGHRGAQNLLGFIYSSGIGTEVDRLKAYYWFSRAAEQGDSVAREKRDELAVSLSAEERENSAKLSEKALQEESTASDTIAALPLPGPGRSGTEIVPVPTDRTEPAAPVITPRSVSDATQSVRSHDDIALVPVVPAGAREPPARFETPQSPDDPAVNAQPAPTSGAYRVQLGTFRVAENAPAAWQDLRQTYAEWLGDLRHEIRRVEARTGGFFHLLSAGPLNDRDAANALCRNLSADGVDCLVVKQ